MTQAISQTRSPRVRTLLPALILVLLATLSVESHGGDGSRFCACVGRRSCAAQESPRLPCRPKRIIIGGAALSSSGQPTVYWNGEVRTQSGDHLVGDLHAFADQAPELPQWPGFPGSCDGTACTTEVAGLDAMLVPGRRLVGTATYGDGATCEIAVMLALTSQSGTLGTFVCRTAAGAVVADGTLDVQLMRALASGKGRRRCCRAE
jgi:hypothetical protein